MDNRTMSTNQYRDYVGMWFEARKELGISDAMSIAKVDIASKNLEWRTFSHSLTDGLGGVAQALRQDGYKCGKLPSSSDSQQPSFWSLLKILLLMPKQKKDKVIKWKYQKNVCAKQQGEICYDFFSEKETAIVKRHAKKHRVTLNHYIFWALNKAVADNLIDGRQNYYWLYPVNLRGPLDFGTDYFNYSSSVNVCVDNDITPKQIHQCVKEQLKSKVYWVNWRLSNIGKIVGMTGVKWIYRLMSNRQFFAGSFSFLGSWPSKDQNNPPVNPDEIYVTCGIGTPNYPVSTGILIWYDRLSLGVKFHPSICDDPQLSNKCLKDWMRYLLTGDTCDQ